MNTENAIQQMRKGVVELCVLSLIASHGELYPAEVREKLKDAGMDVVEGTLYPMLTRLKNSGHLVHRWVETSLGPPRKTYSMTDIGMAFLVELQSSWHDFVGSVNRVVAPQIEATVFAEMPENEVEVVAQIVETASNTEGGKMPKKSKTTKTTIEE
jgi:PadR family transcriptional regulator, regulatory protein PadR